MRRHEAKGVAVPAVDIAKLGVADADRILQHRSKHRLKVAGRAADRLEHLGRGCLLLQRFREFAQAVAPFNSRAFSIAITAWSAKVSTSSICLAVKGFTE